MGHGVSGFGTEFFGMEFRDGVLRVEGGGRPTHRGEAAMNGARSFAQSFGTEFGTKFRMEFSGRSFRDGQGSRFGVDGVFV